MMNAIKFKRKILVAAVGMTVVGLLGMSDAQATAIAFAENMITNFSITSSVDPSGIAVTGTPQRNTDNFATFTGYPGAVFQDPVSLGSASDAREAYSGPGPAPLLTSGFNTDTPGQNNYTFLAGSNHGIGMVGARGDSNTSAGIPFGTPGVSNVNNVAEARVTTGAGQAGSSGGMNTANAAITFAVGLSSSGTITFNFTDLYRYYATTSVNGEGAQGTIANILTITDANPTSPNFGKVIFNDSQSVLNTNCASNSGVPGFCDSGVLTGTFADTSGILAAGNYTISLLTDSAATVTSLAAVPEPASPFLFGIGLSALGFTMGRRKKY